MQLETIRKNRQVLTSVAVWWACSQNSLD